MSADGAGGDGGAKQRFELYIKASAIDKETKGSCPICQHWFMITCILGENQDDIDFKVYTVQADCPPKNFGVEQGWSKKFPVVMVLEGRDKKGQDLAGTKYDTFEELETFFESINKECRELKRKNAPNVAAMKAVEDVYNAFNTFLSNKNAKRLRSELKKINEFLESEDCKFLVDNVLSFADCYLLPRLQHIRVAGKAYMEFDIPPEFTHIWKYLAEAYKMEAFRSTMPSDQDIVFHYEKKLMSSMQKVKRHPRPTLQNFTYTLEIPEDIAATLTRSSDNGHVLPPPEPEERVSNENGSISPPPVREELPPVDVSPPPEEEVQQQVTEQEVVASADDDVAAADVATDNVVAAADEVGSASADADVVVDDVVATDADVAVCESVTVEEVVVTHASAPADDSVAVDDGVGSDAITSDIDGAASEDKTAVVDEGGSGGVSENVVAEVDHDENVAGDVENEKDAVGEEAVGEVSNDDDGEDGVAKKEKDVTVTENEVVKGDDNATAPASGSTD